MSPARFTAVVITVVSLAVSAVSIFAPELTATTLITG